MDAAKLADMESLLRKHHPAAFATTGDAAAVSIEAVWQVEEGELWKAAYGSIEEFYAAHEGQHPDVRVYGDVRREILTADALRGPSGPIHQRIARHRDGQ
jgi:hypothetical protein